MELSMIKLQTASVIPPTIPQSGRKGLNSSSPSFGFKDNCSEELEAQRLQFEDMAANKHNPLGRVAKFAAVGTGAVVAGLATKASLNATSELVAKTMKSKNVAKQVKKGRKLFASSKRFVLNKLNVAKDFVVSQYNKLMATKTVRTMKKSFNKNLLKFKKTAFGAWLFKRFNSLKPKASHLWSSTKKLGRDVRKSTVAHIPTTAKIKTVVVNTVSVGAGLAAGLEGVGIATAHGAEA